MDKALTIEVKPADIINAVKRMKKQDRDAFMEDLIASVSPEYLESIAEARNDYKQGRVQSHEEAFGG
jgi:hypothetical protein